jgi:tetratricopeptide (TPR) repeat protein
MKNDMNMQEDLLSQGIAEVKAGNIQQARVLLDSAIRQNPNDERTWGWFYKVCENDEERIRCLREVLRINPNRETVKKKLDELSNSQNPLQSPKSQPEKISRLSHPIEKVEKGGNHNWIWILALAILFVILCIGGFIVVGRFLINNPAHIQPTVTNVPIVIDVPALFGKSIDEIRELYKVDESLPLQIIEPGSFSNIPQGSYMESNYFGKYNLDFFYDASMHVIGFDVF